ncbi:hypothetical protein [Terracidiphilus gabretensis]|uniref:hypothetical protein n=1 Tax=Terracidiphilus gabretensis TaxID=1577687 RepID=UPI00071C0B4E|nr:hypothetical protein [Terracidiphilus gabretensis]
MPTIFDNVVRKENDHTGLLRNLMDRYPVVASQVLTCLTGSDISEIEAAKLTYRTQWIFEGPGGREIPDIVARGDMLYCLIEAKIDPQLGLTEKQLQGYAECFSDSVGRRHLCFLVPDDWKHCEQVAKIKAVLEPQHINVHRLTWGELVKHLAEAAAKVHSDEILKEVIGFWKWRFESCSMDPKERDFLQSWSGAEYRAIRKLEKAVDQARKLFDARLSQTESETDIGAYGFYIKRDNHYVLWVGIWDKAPTPLGFSCLPAKSNWIKPMKSLSGYDSVNGKFGEHYFWKLQPETWDNPEAIYTTVKSFLDTNY